MKGDFAYFKAGLRILFKAEELQKLMLFLAAVMVVCIMVVTLICAALGLVAGFWLFSAKPAHISWNFVWMCRTSGSIWFLFLCAVLWRHIVYLGKNADRKSMGVKI